MTTISSRSAVGEAARARRWVTAAIVATIAGFTLGFGYVVDEGVFGPLSDLASIAFAVTLIPVALYLHRIFRMAAPRASGVVVGAALVGLPLIVVSAAGLIIRGLLDLSTDVPLLGGQHLGIFLQGVWLAGVGVLGLRHGPYRRRTSLAAVIGGVGYALGAPVSLFMGFETALFYGAFLVALVGFMVWAFTLRSELGERRHEGSGK